MSGFLESTLHQEQVPRKQGLKHKCAIACGCNRKHQEQVPRKQGLKHQKTICYVEIWKHQEQVPRKQGLKLHYVSARTWYFQPSRASSTKTRIETHGVGGCAQNLTSIKSKFHENKDWNYTPCTISIISSAHQEQVPRKQGLKQLRSSGMVMSSIHQEQVPRKQGLKQYTSWSWKGVDLPSRASSTKTRIETLGRRSIASLRPSIKSKFHENKDWNSNDINIDDKLTEHQEQVPRKQGLKP